MPTFAYQAADGTGREVSGTLEAADRGAAVKQLSGRGLQPFKVSEAKGGKAETAQPAKTKSKGQADAQVPAGPVKLSSMSLQIFTEELAELLEAGMRLEPALKLMEGRGGDTTPHRRAAKRIGDLVREGHPFSSAVKMASPSFGELFTSVAAAGEAGGALASGMRRQAVYIAKSRELAGKVGAALIYPAFLFVAGAGLVILFATYLLPKLTSLVESTRGSLPPMAKYMLRASDLLKANWWLFLLVAAIAGLAVLMWARSPQGKPVWHRLKLSLPFVGGVLRASLHSQFLETLASLSSGGLPLLRGLELASKVTTNVYAQAQLAKTIDQVRDGAALSRSLEKTNLFPTTLLEMVRLGEHTGDLPGALRRAADRCGRELEKSLEKAAALVQPMIILVMALIVGMMAYMIISIVFDTISQLRPGGRHK
ncbi:MAG: type II secretion system F family protein [Verrucomicrobiaceae bacterium]|nr:type II secretion system F family protein [Verrucomicrobiaceae bacterium]